MTSKHCSIKAIGLLLFLAVVASYVDSICWNCQPESLSDDEIDRILAEDFKKRLMEKLGLTKEPQLPENKITPPQELINEIYDEHPRSHEEDEEDKGAMQTILLQPLNNDSRVTNTSSFHEYEIDEEELKGYRVVHVTLWLYVSRDTNVYKVYERASILPRRMVLMNKHRGSDSGWVKLMFTPSRLWLKNPWRKMRIEIEGIEASVTNKPMLQLDIKRVERRVEKRAYRANDPITGSCDSKAKYCCKHRRTIQLQNHLNWLIAPKSYQAFTCSGDCPIKHKANSTWTFLSQIATPNSRPPCCAPTSFATITIIYQKEKLVKVKGTNTMKKTVSLYRRKVHDMQVKSCGCL